MENPLALYIRARGKSETARLADATDLRWQTIDDIAKGKSVPRPETAAVIEKATGDEVTAAALYEWFVAFPPPRQPARVGIKRRGRKAARNRSSANGHAVAR